MILSVHIPKTAGTMFHHQLAAVFGSRLKPVYDEWSEMKTADSDAHNTVCRERMIENRQQIELNYDVIHGHFLARNYRDIFGDVKLLKFVRDAYQHAMSTYSHAQRLQDRSHPGVRLFDETRMTLFNMIEMFPIHHRSTCRTLPGKTSRRSASRSNMTVA